jgi:hypothetical protein
MPKVHVGSVLAEPVVSRDKAKATEVGDLATYPQIPVLRTSMVTSPGLRLSPLFTSSRVGLDSATHRSCLGLVKTPMLGFSRTVAVAMFQSGESAVGGVENTQTEERERGEVKRVKVGRSKLGYNQIKYLPLHVVRVLFFHDTNDDE